MGDNVTLVNPAYETAKLTKTILKEKELESSKLDGGKVQYYVSDDPEKFKRVGGNLLGREIKEVKKVNIEGN